MIREQRGWQGAEERPESGTWGALSPEAGNTQAFRSSCAKTNSQDRKVTFWRWIALFRTPEDHRANYFDESAK